MFDQNSVDNSFKETLKLNVLSQFETGNILLDSIIRMFFITLITSLTGRILMVISDFGELTSFFSIFEAYQKIYFWFKKPKTLKIV